MALVASAARAAGAAEPPQSGVPSPAAITYVTRKCAGCHRPPVAGGRWAPASVSMHARRVAITPADWQLLREYFSEVGRRR